ncbi:uncharacterized protein DC041_0004683 [Schistosoma bovis]|uniref:Uncharacterized protein n=1 Tax=Schistosoma bovis TaxID=6184 RepID=A0A430QC48_SCHBO|nr:uncharacterized protein DC041_0004683 [Schistosoma bovis]
MTTRELFPIMIMMRKNPPLYHKHYLTTLIFQMLKSVIKQTMSVV